MGSQRISRSIFRYRDSVVTPVKTYTIPAGADKLYLLRRIYLDYRAGAVAGTRTIQIRSRFLNEQNNAFSDEAYFLDAAVVASTAYRFYLAINNPHLLTPIIASGATRFKQRIPEIMYKQHDQIIIGAITEVDPNDFSDLRLDFEIIPRVIETGAI
jgi:hypothetical protein